VIQAAVILMKLSGMSIDDGGNYSNEKLVKMSLLYGTFACGVVNMIKYY
jgi:hypothetical protein